MKMSVIKLENVLSTLKGLDGFDQNYVRECADWWKLKAAVWPDIFESDEGNGDAVQSMTVNKMRQDLPITSSFDFYSFIGWYSQFIISNATMRGKKMSEETKDQCLKLNNKLIDVAFDPTVYPISEQPLDMRTRTTRSGGKLSFVTAELPEGFQIPVVAKKVPSKKLFLQEKVIHQTLRKLGYQRGVTECVSSDNNQVLTYGRLAGSLASLSSQSEEVKKKYILKTLDILTRISLDFKKHIEVGPVLDDDIVTLCDIIRENTHSDKYLVERFAQNYFFRVVASADGMYQSGDQKELQLFFDVMMGKENERKVTNGLKERYPHLSRAATDPKVKSQIAAYLPLARMIDNLEKFPGHDDLRGDNVLAEEIGIVGNGEDGKQEFYYEKLKLHDIGLVNVPFQNFIFDITVSVGSSPQLQQEIVRIVYNDISKYCAEMGIEFKQSSREFERGYKLVAASKYLTQASLSHMDNVLGVE